MTSHSRLSLAHRLSLLTGSVIAACVLVVLAAAHEVLTRSAITAMEARLATATNHLAGIAQANVRQLGARYAGAAHDPALKAALALGETPGRSAASRDMQKTLAAAREVMVRLTLPTDSTQRLELWNAKHELITFVTLSIGGVTDSATLGITIALRQALDHASGRDSSVQLSRLSVVKGRVYLWIVQPVVERGAVIGCVAQLRRLEANSQTDRSMRALAGEGVSMYYANDDGSVWTSLGSIPAPPQPIPNTRMAAAHPDREALTASAAIVGTPLLLVMQSERSYVLAAVRSTLEQLLVIGVTIIVAAMGAALLIGRRVARPVVAIADAAHAVARGQYDVRVSGAHEAELARLADSFNHMANEVAAAEETRRQLAHMGRVAAVAELASSITHELRQPLTAILANSESALILLRRPTPDLDHLRSCVENIIGDCDRAASVMTHVRVLLRKEDRITTVVDLNEICRKAVHLLRQDAALRRTRVDLALAPNALRVVGDPVQLQQVVINLTLNALDAAAAVRTNRRVSVSTTSSHSAAEIVVRDNGPGLSLDSQQRLFEPFFTTKNQGLGMGLAIVRSIVERHHGRVHAEDGLGVGAVFRVSLPPCAAPAPEKQRAYHFRR